MSNSPVADELVAVLGDSQRLGFLGPGPIEAHIDNASRFVAAMGDDSPSRALDLGSGGGLPGLVLATQLPHIQWSFLDASGRRCDFLTEALDRLRIDADVHVGRAEDLARAGDLRHQFSVVVARSFGPPAVAAECATGFLCTGGRLLVSEPPDHSGGRWDSPSLAQLGLTWQSSQHGVAQLTQTNICGDRWPRRNGIPSKRPLF